MSLESIIDRYCEAWSAPSPELRVAALADVWADSGTYTDPSQNAVGAEQLLTHIANVLNTYPGGRVLRTSVVDHHHGLARFAWQMVLADGQRSPKYLDIATLSADGTRIHSIVGFFGPLKPL